MHSAHGYSNWLQKWQVHLAVIVCVLITYQLCFFSECVIKSGCICKCEPRAVWSEYLPKPLCLRDGVFTEQVKSSNRCDAGLNRWCKNAKRSGGLVPVLLLQYIDWPVFQKEGRIPDNNPPARKLDQELKGSNY